MGVKGLWDVCKHPALWYTHADIYITYMQILLPAAQQRSLDEIAVNEGFAQNRHGRHAVIIGVNAA